MRSEGHDAIYAHLDVLDESNWSEAVAQTLDAFGRLDVLVNLAGMQDRGTLYDVDVNEWQKVMEISTTGILLGTRAVIPAMTESGGGSIINMSSMAGKFAGEYGSAYAMSRAGMLHFTRASAIQLAKFGIRANSILPGWVHTPFTKHIYATDSEREWRSERVPLGRWGEPEEIANGICFLASEEASYITGSELLIDGGVTAGFKGNTMPGGD
jgi:NAD(P)-dependent dehydrogenase (short-subunit alcohol dehydrogenase family)